MMEGLNTQEYINFCKYNNLKEIDEFLDKKSKEDIIQIWANLNSTNEEQIINLYLAIVAIISITVAVIMYIFSRTDKFADISISAYMILLIAILLKTLSLQRSIQKRDYAKELLRLYIEKGSIMKSLDRE